MNVKLLHSDAIGHEEWELLSKVLVVLNPKQSAALARNVLAVRGQTLKRPDD